MHPSLRFEGRVVEGTEGTTHVSAVATYRYQYSLNFTLWKRMSEESSNLSRLLCLRVRGTALGRLASFQLQASRLQPEGRTRLRREHERFIVRRPHKPREKHVLRSLPRSLTPWEMHINKKKNYQQPRPLRLCFVKYLPIPISTYYIVLEALGRVCWGG